MEAICNYKGISKFGFIVSSYESSILKISRYFKVENNNGKKETDCHGVAIPQDEVLRFYVMAVLQRDTCLVKAGMRYTSITLIYPLILNHAWC
jgi:hypothetical protein